MPRSIWSGTISFGMVSIPVNLYTATQDKDISFHLLHEECGNRVKQLRWCPFHERPVEWDEVERGYEYAKNEYVVLTDEDFEKLPLPSKHTIELSAFVKSQEIDPIFYEKSYYLEPKQEGAKAFALLMRVLEEKGLVGLAKIAIRNKEQLCALRPQDEEPDPGDAVLPRRDPGWARASNRRVQVSRAGDGDGDDARGRAVAAFRARRSTTTSTARH